MNNDRLHIGIDIGTTHVLCVIGVINDGEEKEPSIIGLGSAENQGMRRGSIVDADAVAKATNQAIDEAERMSGRRVDHATVAVGGSYIKSINSKGVIAVGGSDREITHDDLARVEDAAMVIQMPANREIVQIFPRKYRLDGQDDIKDPLGMRGIRLEVDAHIVTSATPVIKNIRAVLEQVGVAVESLIVSPIAASEAVLSRKQRENGSAVIDIGASTTGIAVYEEGEILHTANIAIGSGHVTNDLAIGLRTDLQVAEDIKLDYGSAVTNPEKGKTIAIIQSDKEEVKISQRDIDDIVQARLEELFRLANRELQRIHKAGQLPGGVVLTGGGALMRHIDTFAKDALKLPARVGAPKHVSGVIEQIDNPQYSVVVGLMLDSMRADSGAGSQRIALSQTVNSAKGIFNSLFRRFKP